MLHAQFLGEQRIVCMLLAQGFLDLATEALLALHRLVA